MERFNNQRNESSIQKAIKMLDILGFVIAVIGIPSSIYGLYCFSKLVYFLVNRTRITANVFLRCAKLTAREIVRRMGSPDIIIGVGLGGSVWAGVLGEYLKVAGKRPDIISFDWDSTNNKKNIIYKSSYDLSGKVVLICTAEDWTGELLNLAKVKAEQISDSKVRTSSLYSLHKQERSTKLLSPDMYPLPDFVGVYKTRKQLLPWQEKKKG